MRPTTLCIAPCLLLAGLAAGAPDALASSHREAPFITEQPKVDGTDFYMFRSYEPGRDGFVTLIANYLPLQDPYGGPNYFNLDPEARYAIRIDNDGDGIEDVSFVFRTFTQLKGIALPIGGEDVTIPLIQAGVINSAATVNRSETYSVNVVRGALGTGLGGGQALVNRRTGGTRFGKPIDNIGAKTFPDYAGYAAQFVLDAGIPGCGDGRVFVGQRKDPFVVNLGEVFDLVNFNPVGAPDSQSDDLADANVTSFALEVPIDCLTGGGDVIGGWTTAHLPRTRTLVDDPSFDRPEDGSADFVQVSRLGMPLVNELVIGLPDKNRFNGSRPDGDGRFATYVTNPTLPALLELLFGVGAPTNIPRLDLVAAFVTGIDGLNRLGFGEMQRLNVTIAPTPRAQQSNLGVAGGDNAGFPNGRRPGDDVVDAELRVAMGLLCHAFPGAFGCGPADAPAGNLPLTDGATVDATFFDNAFPYVKTPLAGSPQ
ncbi:MAG: DUF4331 domain-containing protein [Chloroflexi bacterium]|nr:DUF4331 domain-containing protein [Chloroflexota bacterium]